MINTFLSGDDETKRRREHEAALRGPAFCPPPKAPFIFNSKINRGGGGDEKQNHHSDIKYIRLFYF